MTESKFTDEEVIKALECCTTNKCDECDIYKECHNENGKGRVQVVLDLINRQKAEIDILIRKHDTLLDELSDKQAEIERLEEDNSGLSICLDSAVKTALEIKSKVIKEFAERLKYRYRVVEISSGGFIPAVIRKDIDNLVKEMTEDNK